jgi:hypothetical protein
MFLTLFRLVPKRPVTLCMRFVSERLLAHHHFLMCTATNTCCTMYGPCLEATSSIDKPETRRITAPGAESVLIYIFTEITFLDLLMHMFFIFTCCTCGRVLGKSREPLQIRISMRFIVRTALLHAVLISRFIAYCFQV